MRKLRQDFALGKRIKGRTGCGVAGDSSAGHMDSGR